MLDMSCFDGVQRPGSPEITYPYPLYKMEDDRKKSKLKPNQVGTVYLYGIRIVSLAMDGKERLCLAQISNTLLKDYSYNEIHNRRVALGITCVQCTPVQLEILRRAGAMPISSRRCGMITKREAERLCKSFLGDNSPPKLPENFAFEVYHECAWGSRGQFVPSRYNSSRAKCIKCHFCGIFFSPNKFVFHSHRLGDSDKYVQPDAANFNSWRRHTKLLGDPPEEIVYAWEDIKAMFNGGTRKRMLACAASSVASPTSSVASLSTASAAPSGHGFPHLHHPLISPEAIILPQQSKRLKSETTSKLPIGTDDKAGLSYMSRFQSIESLIASTSSSSLPSPSPPQQSVLPSPNKLGVADIVTSSYSKVGGPPPPPVYPFDYVWPAMNWSAVNFAASFPYPLMWPKPPLLAPEGSSGVGRPEDSKQSSPAGNKPEELYPPPMSFAQWFAKRRHCTEAIFGGSPAVAAAAAAAAAANVAAVTAASSGKTDAPPVLHQHGQTRAQATEGESHFLQPHFSAFRPVSSKGTSSAADSTPIGDPETSCSEVSTTVEVNEKASTPGKETKVAAAADEVHVDIEEVTEIKRETETACRESPQDFSIVKIVATDNC